MFLFSPPLLLSTALSGFCLRGCNCWKRQWFFCWWWCVVFSGEDCCCFFHCHHWLCCCPHCWHFCCCSSCLRLPRQRQKQLSHGSSLAGQQQQVTNFCCHCFISSSRIHSLSWFCCCWCCLLSMNDLQLLTMLMLFTVVALTWWGEFHHWPLPISRTMGTSSPLWFCKFCLFSPHPQEQVATFFTGGFATFIFFWCLQQEHLDEIAVVASMARQQCHHCWSHCKSICHWTRRSRLPTKPDCVFWGAQCSIAVYEFCCQHMDSSLLFETLKNMENFNTKQCMPKHRACSKFFFAQKPAGCESFQCSYQVFFFSPEQLSLWHTEVGSVDLHTTTFPGSHVDSMVLFNVTGCARMQYGTSNFSWVKDCCCSVKYNVQEVTNCIHPRDAPCQQQKDDDTCVVVVAVNCFLC